MRFFRYSVLAATLGGLAVGAQVVACGGDDEKSATVDVPDSGTNAAVNGPVLTVSDSRAKLYLGQTAKIDGASVAPNVVDELVWTVVVAPSESKLKTETLQDANTATPSFKPDVLGNYTLQVTGKKDGVSSSVLVFIEALDAPVFWRQARISGDSNGGENGDENGSQYSFAVSTHAGGVNGSWNRAVGCTYEPADAGGAAAEYALLSARFASAGDAWEAPPGSPSRVAFIDFTIDAATNAVTTSLNVASSTSACSGPDAKRVDVAETDAGTPQPTDFIYNARFSPDGNRIAYVHDVRGTARVATVGFDGSGKRDVSSFQASADDAGALDPDAGTVIRGGGGVPTGPNLPRWMDNSHVGWVTLFGPNAAESALDWELFVVEDKEGATPTLAMRCSGYQPRGFDFLSDGSIVMSARHLLTSDGGDVAPLDLIVFRANAETKQCEVVRNLTNGTSSDSVARDLALSPDKSVIAFFSGKGTGEAIDANNALTLSIVPVDGSRAPAAVPGAPTGADPGIGPRWISGGTTLTWGQMAGNQGGGPLPSGVGQQVSIPVSGGEMKTLVQGSMSQTVNADGGMHIDYRVAYGIGQGCGVAPGAASSGAMAVGGVFGLAALVARRKRRASK